MVYELAERHDNGIQVRLLWDAARNQAVIRYRDRRLREAFVVEVPSAKALFAFQHPNAYRPRPLAA
jgi:hypothetical protein